MAAAAQPTGTVTMVFTDIEGSTRLLEELGVEAYRDALTEHRRVVREACARHAGYEVDCEGDAFFYAFATAPAAVSAVSEAMRRLESGPIRIRVGIHTGQPALDGSNYVGMDIHRAARIMASAHGGQVVLSPSTVALIEPGAFPLKHLGEHRLKDLSAPIPLHQLGLDGLPDSFPPLKTLYRSNLPVPATPFLGREVELRQVTELLQDTSVRLLTLTGPGGTGKTRLALQAAAEVAGDYPDGITWVGLAPLHDPGLAMPAVAQALELREEPGRSLADTIAHALLGKSVLLVLDNAEHLMPDVARRLAELMAACQTVRLLVTSRERLRLTGEAVWSVPTLSEDDSVELFLQRARAVRADFAPTTEIAEICAALDHLPLAIELAAARTRALSPAAILERLGRRLALLRADALDVDARQQTLEATIAWSYDLLDASEQRALRALSVFAGGCALDAAEQVAGADLDLVERLLDRSLLRHRIERGEDRYWMLETIREFAEARLVEADEAREALGRLLDWLDGVVGAVDEGWVERDQLEWFVRLEVERANLVNALARSRAEGRHDRAVRLLVSAHEFVDAWGPYAPFLELLEGTASGDPYVDGRRRLLAVYVHMRLGQMHDAELEAGRLAESGAADPALRARSLAIEGFFVLQRGEADEAALVGAEALRQGRAVDDPRAVSSALNTIGLAEMALGDHAAADAHLRASVAQALEIGDRRNALIAQANVALLLLARRRPREAAAMLRELIDGASLQGPTMTVMQLGNLACALAAAGDGWGARRALEEAIELDVLQFQAALAVEGPLVLALAAVHEGTPELAVTLWSAASAAQARLDYVLGPELDVYIADLLEPLRARGDFDAPVAARSGALGQRRRGTRAQGARLTSGGSCRRAVAMNCAPAVIHARIGYGCGRPAVGDGDVGVHRYRGLDEAARAAGGGGVPGGVGRASPDRP